MALRVFPCTYPKIQSVRHDVWKASRHIFEMSMFSPRWWVGDAGKSMASMVWESFMRMAPIYGILLEPSYCILWIPMATERSRNIIQYLDVFRAEMVRFQITPSLISGFKRVCHILMDIQTCGYGSMFTNGSTRERWRCFPVDVFTPIISKAVAGFKTSNKNQQCCEKSWIQTLQGHHPLFPGFYHNADYNHHHRTRPYRARWGEPSADMCRFRGKIILMLFFFP